MFFSINHKAASALGLALAVSSAPLNERAISTASKRGLVGWLCHYDGPPAPAVDVNLDIPSLLGALCAKVNFEFAGCESFDPRAGQPALPEQPQLPEVPTDDGTAIAAKSVPEGEETPVQVPAPKRKKHSKGGKGGKKAPQDPNRDDGTNAANSGDDGSNFNGANNGNPDANAAIPDAKGGIPDANAGNPADSGAQSGENAGDPDSGAVGDDGLPVNAHSFTDTGDNGSNDHPHHSHSGSAPEKDPNSSLGALSAGDSDDYPTECQPTEFFSSELQRCVDQGSFTKPQADSICQNGTLDALLKLCLDITTLGLTEPIHAEATVLPTGPIGPGTTSALSAPDGSSVNGCPAGQQLSSLLSICVDIKFFSNPLGGGQCQSGWKLDLLLGTCLDLAGCQNH